MKCSIPGCRNCRVWGRNEKGKYHKLCLEHINQTMNPNYTFAIPNYILGAINLNQERRLGTMHRLGSTNFNPMLANFNPMLRNHNHIPKCVLCIEPRVKGWNKFSGGYITHCKHHLNCEPLPKCSYPPCSNKRMWCVEHKYRYCAGDHCMAYECSQTGCHRITGPNIRFCNLHR